MKLPKSVALIDDHTAKGVFTEDILDELWLSSARLLSESYRDCYSQKRKFLYCAQAANSQKNILHNRFANSFLVACWGDGWFAIAWTVTYYVSCRNYYECILEIILTFCYFITENTICRINKLLCCLQWLQQKLHHSSLSRYIHDLEGGGEVGGSVSVLAEITLNSRNVGNSLRNYRNIGLFERLFR